MHGSGHSHLPGVAIRALVPWRRLLTAAFFSFGLADIVYAETMSFGGPRDVVVEIDDADRGFSVVVEMRAVSCFDPATNARVNRTKAYLFGLAGLAKALDLDEGRLSSDSSVTGMTVDAADVKGERYRLRFYFPELAIGRERGSLVSDGPISDDDKGPADSPPKRSQLFTCVDDYETTIHSLRVGFEDRLQDALRPIAAPLASPDMSRTIADVRLAVTTVEHDAARAFAALKTEVEGDLRMLSIEKESLGKAIAVATKQWTATLGHASDRLTAVDKESETTSVTMPPTRVPTPPDSP